MSGFVVVELFLMRVIYIRSIFARSYQKRMVVAGNSVPEAPFPYTCVVGHPHINVLSLHSQLYLVLLHFMEITVYQERSSETKYHIILNIRPGTKFHVFKENHG